MTWPEAFACIGVAWAIAWSIITGFREALAFDREMQKSLEDRQANREG